MTNPPTPAPDGDLPSALHRWWHRNPHLRLVWLGICNPLHPVPPWVHSEAAEQKRREWLRPITRRYRRQYLIAKYGDLGEWWCPNCGAWIESGDGKWTDDPEDNYIVHRWCK